LLAAQSPVFDRIFFGHSRESSLRVQGSLDASLAFFGYFYSGSCQLTDELVTYDVHQLALTYDVEPLQTLCEDWLTTNLTPKRCLYLFQNAMHKFDAFDTKFSQSGPLESMWGTAEKARQIIQARFAEIMSSDSEAWCSLEAEAVSAILDFDKLQAPEETILDAALMWLEHDDKRRSRAEAVLQAVRLPCLAAPRLLVLCQHPLLAAVPSFMRRYLTAIQWQLWVQTADKGEAPDTAVAQLRHLLAQGPGKHFVSRTDGLPQVLRKRKWDPVWRSGGRASTTVVLSGNNLATFSSPHAQLWQMALACQTDPSPSQSPVQAWTFRVLALPSRALQIGFVDVSSGDLELSGDPGNVGWLWTSLPSASPSGGGGGGGGSSSLLLRDGRPGLDSEALLACAPLKERDTVTLTAETALDGSLKLGWRVNGVHLEGAAGVLAAALRPAVVARGHGTVSPRAAHPGLRPLD
jgi:hypothetical protein